MTTAFSYTIDHVQLLQKENAELRAKLDAWEKQSPVAWMTKDNGNGQYAMWGQKPTAQYYVDYPEDLISLFTKPKEA